MRTLLALFCLIAVSARAELEFTAFFTTPNETFILLTDKETQTKSGWLKKGQSFAGHTIESLEPNQETLVLKRGEERVRLRIRESKIKDGKTPITGYIEVGAGEKIEGVRTVIYLDEEAVFPVKPGTTLFLKASRLPDGNLVYSARFEIVQKEEAKETIQFARIVVRPGYPFSFRSGEYGFGFKP